MMGGSRSLRKRSYMLIPNAATTLFQSRIENQCALKEALLSGETIVVLALSIL
jgi:hypothetical protein